VLLRINSINFDVQGRTTKVLNRTDATFLTSVALGFLNINYNTVQVQYETTYFGSRLTVLLIGYCTE